MSFPSNTAQSDHLIKSPIKNVREMFASFPVSLITSNTPMMLLSGENMVASLPDEGGKLYSSCSGRCKEAWFPAGGQLLLWWRDGSGGLQDPSQHLVVVKRLVLFGGVTGAVICGVGIREAQDPKTIRWQHDICLFRMKEWTGRRTRLDLKMETQF